MRWCNYLANCTNAAVTQWQRQRSKGAGHFEVRKSSTTRSPGCNALFSSKKLTTFFQLLPSKHRPPTPFHRRNETNKAARYGNIFIFCSHYYRSKAIRRARPGDARAVDLSARSFDMACCSYHKRVKAQNVCHLAAGSARTSWGNLSATPGPLAVAEEGWE